MKKHFIQKHFHYYVIMILICICFSAETAGSCLAADLGYGLYCEGCTKKVDKFTSKTEHNSSSDHSTGEWDDNNYVYLYCGFCRRQLISMANCSSRDSDGYHSSTKRFSSYCELPSQKIFYSSQEHYLSEMMSQLSSLEGTTFSWKTWLTCKPASVDDYNSYGIAAYLKLIGYGFVVDLEHTVTYDANGGSGSMAASVIATDGGNLRPNSFNRTGYTFQGWSTVGAGAVMYADGAAYVPSGDITLYAIWEINRYTVSIDGSGENGSTSAAGAEYGSSHTIQAGNRKGYTFQGWSAEGLPAENITGGSLKAASFTFAMPDQDVKLTANWSANAYDITVHNTGEGDTITKGGNYGEQQTLDAGLRLGHHFVKWSFPDETKKAKLASETSSPAVFTMPDNPVILQAEWQANSYMVTAGNLGEGGYGSGSFYYGDSVTICAGSRDGYYFKGWKLEGDSAEPEAADLSMPRLQFPMPPGNVNLTADWAAVRGIFVTCSDAFAESYKKEAFYREDLDAYDITKEIILEKKDVDVSIQTDDGMLSITDYSFVNDKISCLGINNIKIKAAFGTILLEAVLPLEGYCPPLSETMENLGLQKKDYKGLAEKIVSMQREIKELQKETENYERLLEEIKEKLKEQSIELEIKDELEQNLKNANKAIEEAVKRIAELEDKLVSVYSWINLVADELGLPGLVKDYESFVTGKDEVLSRIRKLKSENQRLKDEYNRLLKAIGMEEEIGGMDESSQEMLDSLVKKAEEIQKNLEVYEEMKEKLKELLEIENDGTEKEQAAEIVEQVHITKKKLYELEQETEDAENQIAQILDTKKADLSDLDKVRKLINSLRTRIEEYKNQIGKLETEWKMQENEIVSLETIIITLKEELEKEKKEQESLNTAIEELKQKEGNWQAEKENLSERLDESSKRAEGLEKKLEMVYLKASEKENSTQAAHEEGKTEKTDSRTSDQTAIANAAIKQNRQLKEQMSSLARGLQSEGAELEEESGSETDTIQYMEKQEEKVKKASLFDGSLLITWLLVLIGVSIIIGCVCYLEKKKADRDITYLD